jgi:hypothetical protein
MAWRGSAVFGTLGWTMRLRAVVISFMILLPVLVLPACTSPATSGGTTQDEAYPHRYDGAGGGGGGGGGGM